MVHVEKCRKHTSAANDMLLSFLALAFSSTSGWNESRYRSVYLLVILEYGSSLPEILPFTTEFSFLEDAKDVRDIIGVTGSTFRTGACLLPAGAPKRRVISGELYMPKTSANASFVARVTVGSA